MDEAGLAGLTPFQQHDFMEKEAAEFVGGMLHEIKLTLPYGNLHCVGADFQYHPDPPESFQLLRAISKHIQDTVEHKRGSFLTKIHEDFENAFDAGVAMSNPREVSEYVLKGSLRNGIIEIIWRMHECIRYVRSTSPEDLHDFMEEFQMSGYFARYTWESYVRKWEDEVEQWTQFLALYDSVFPRVLWDIPGAMGALIIRYPAVFYKVFGDDATDAESLDHLSTFQQYLIYQVAPNFQNIPHEGQLETSNSYNDLRGQLERLKRLRSEEEARGHFAQHMRSLAMNDEAHGGPARRVRSRGISRPFR